MRLPDLQTNPTSAGMAAEQSPLLGNAVNLIVLTIQPWAVPLLKGWGPVGEESLETLTITQGVAGNARWKCIVLPVFLAINLPFMNAFVHLLHLAGSAAGTA